MKIIKHSNAKMRLNWFVDKILSLVDFNWHITSAPSGLYKNNPYVVLTHKIKTPIADTGEFNEEDLIEELNEKVKDKHMLVYSISFETNPIGSSFYIRYAKK